MHTLLDLRGNIPSFIFVSDGKMHDVNILAQLVPEPGAIYVMDRGYVDFERLGRFHEAGSSFVIRAKRNLKARRRYSAPVDRSTGLICDQTVTLTGFYSQRGFPAPLQTHPLQRSRDGQAARLSHQQLRAAGADHHRAVPPTLADRAVLQVDQAAPADQGVLR